MRYICILIIFGLVIKSSFADIPKKGNFSITSGLKMEYNPTKQSDEGHMQGPFTVVGVSFNDSGSGMFHNGTFDCSASAHALLDGQSLIVDFVL